MVAGWLIRSQPRSWLRRMLQMSDLAASVIIIHARPFSDRKDVRAWTLVTDSPDIITSADIIPSITPIPRHHIDRQSEILAVFLLTPSLARLLDDQHHFIRDALSQLCHGEIPTINTIAAVVDRVPTLPRPLVDPEHNAGSEGLSLLLVDSQGQKVSHHHMVRPEEGLPGQRQHISFIFPNFLDTPNSPSHVRRHDKLDVPLANTIFQNGRRSTLLMSRWSGHDSLHIPTSASTNPRVFLPEAISGARITRDFIPLISLTLPRRIVAGVGNIIRKVSPDDLQSQNDGGDVHNAVPASQELENAVQAHFEALRLPPQHVTVWALIISREAEIAKKRHTGVYMSLRTKQVSQKLPVARREGLIKSGCHLHRVLSGGGGWGHKQGLLALDPESSFDAGESALSLFDADEAVAEDGQRRALGEIVRPGDIVQFFVQGKNPAFQCSKAEDSPAEDGEREDSTVQRGFEKLPSFSTLAFGTIPSAIDTVSRTSHSARFKILQRLFGALSEHGIGHQTVEVKDKGPSDLSGLRVLQQSKIDVPFSMTRRYYPCKLQPHIGSC